MNPREKTVTLARSSVSYRCHVCAFFYSRDDEYEIMVPFLKEGIEAGDRGVQIMDQRQRVERRDRLVQAGVDVANAELRGQLEVRSWEGAYLRGRRFDQHAMISLLEDVATVGERQGTGITRLWANMEWALEDLPGVHDIVEYESRLNRVLPAYGIATVCTYDLTKFSASIVMDILRTHPQVIVGGILRENLFYVPPDEFLKELDDRRKAR